MAEDRTPSERFLDWLESAEIPDRAGAVTNFRVLYRQPGMIYFLKQVAGRLDEGDRIGGHDLMSDEGRMNALKTQGRLEGLSAVLEMCAALAIPEETEDA